jgi:hypothetical protein
MLKRLLDDKIRSRLSNAIDNEIMLRILTLNLMILLVIALQRVLNKAGRSPFSGRSSSGSASAGPSSGGGSLVLFRSTTTRIVTVP